MADDEWWLAWIRSWADQLNTMVTRLSATFEDRYGFPPGVNQIRWATAEDRVWADQFQKDPLSVAEFGVFYQVVGEVSLPDVANGFFIHSARSVLTLQKEVGYVFLPHADDPHGMVIGSDGGGIQYVMDWGGAVHRSTTASLDGDFEQVASSVKEFLMRLSDVVNAFAGDNRVVKL